MTVQNDPKTSPPMNAELKLERVFDATPQRLWTYWVDPRKYARWLNPSGIPLVIHEWDAREGGRMRFDMPQPDGNKNPQEGVFHVLRPYEEIQSGDADKTFLLTVRFEPVSATQTRMVVIAKGVPPEWHAPATVGWGQSFDHLTNALRTPTGTGFTIERTFRSPPEKVWRMWTTPEGIAKWWGAGAREMGYDFQVLHMDVRPGGEYAYSMRNKEHDLVNRGTYVEVTPHQKLAMIWAFDIFLAPGDAPYDVPITVTLARTPDGGTRMTFEQGPLATPEFTDGSRQGVTANLSHMAAALGEEEGVN